MSVPDEARSAVDKSIAQSAVSSDEWKPLLDFIKSQGFVRLITHVWLADIYNISRTVVVLFKLEKN
jgi:hypothetical protein